MWLEDWLEFAIVEDWTGLRQVVDEGYRDFVSWMNDTPAATSSAQQVAHALKRLLEHTPNPDDPLRISLLHDAGNWMIEALYPDADFWTALYSGGTQDCRICLEPLQTGEECVRHRRCRQYVGHLVCAEKWYTACPTRVCLQCNKR